MTFHGWLMHNRWRSDLIGDLARDSRWDEGWPQDGKKLADFKTYLKRRGACDGARQALRQAWVEYGLWTDGVARVP